ncbi:MAG: hypothetical protein QOD72_3886 [Acidimicrobiaceae bacterium]|jgi:MYXO-CTERM domain-containing protein|nr:hypothetical protein [Acidimicrobiaceae bacterium]
MAGAAVVVVGAFLPWVRSGTATRNSFAMLRIADDLGVVHGWARRTMLVTWFFVPAACGALVLVSLARRRWPFVVLAGAIGLVALIMWGTALRSPLALTYGAAVNQGGVALLVLGALVSIRARRNDHV